jgi:hypothetical protein
LADAKCEGIQLKLGAAIHATDPGCVIEANTQQQTIGLLSSKFSAARPFMTPSRGNPLNAIASNAEWIDHRC